jgi:hypothetical protein
MLAALVTEYALWLVELPQGSTGAPTFLGSWSQTGLRAVALLLSFCEHIALDPVRVEMARR